MEEEYGLIADMREHLAQDAAYGILIDEVSGEQQYRWGHFNENAWDPWFYSSVDEIEEVIYPFS